MTYISRGFLITCGFLLALTVVACVVLAACGLFMNLTDPTVQNVFSTLTP